jgi:hypothetical protein
MLLVLWSAARTLRAVVSTATAVTTAPGPNSRRPPALSPTKISRIAVPTVGSYPATTPPPSADSTVTERMAGIPSGASVSATWEAATTVRLMRITSPCPERVGWGRPMKDVPTMIPTPTSRVTRT